MPTHAELPTTAVLLIDSSKKQRTYWANELRRCSADYEIVEASNAQAGLDLYRSGRIDCVVLELSLPDQSGFKTLVEFVPLVSRPRVAVVVLTLITHPGIWRLAKDSGAHACLAKEFTSGEHLDRAIQRAVAFVGSLPKEDPFRPI